MRITSAVDVTFGAGIAQWCSAGLRDDWTFESHQGLGIFLFTTTSKPALKLTEPPIQLLPGALPLGVERSGRESDHSPPLPNTPSWRGAQFKKNRDNFNFYLYL
jgi:hypothetical protein